MYSLENVLTEVGMQKYVALTPNYILFFKRLNKLELKSSVVSLSGSPC